jgi:pyruvate/2-oxoacid:ferredoxin oxidoreductase alpha subunit/Pyruvate/2-oxoacid:ferredoxin oxidoreductase gamma subunit
LFRSERLLMKPEIQTSQDSEPNSAAKNVKTVSQHIVEIVSDSGEGAQTCGQMFGTIGAKMGNGVWTVEIIPAEIEPPQRSTAGASGNRVRLGSTPVTNAGDAADVVISFNEQVLYSRIDVGALRPGTIIFLDRVWAEDPSAEIREAYATAVQDFADRGFMVVEIPLQSETLRFTDEPRRGKNMWALGLLCALYERDMEIAQAEVRKRFARKGEEVTQTNLNLLQAGYDWATENLSVRFRVPVQSRPEPMVVMNGNQAVGLGIMAAGMELCAMYPITPATSASHYLASAFHTGPSTGLPTKIEQGDLLAALFASPGDSPKIVMAPATIEECFHFMITARKLAEEFRGPVIVLTDANLATGQQPFKRPQVCEEWLAPPYVQSAWDADVAPYAWDPETGFSGRPIPGQKGGEYVLTGLAHDERSKVAYESAINQRAMMMRSRKLAALEQSLKPAEVFGEPSGDLLVITWGSTLGAAREAVERVQADGGKVSHLHLRFLSPLERGLKEIFDRFRKVMTVEINYSDSLEDPLIYEGNRRRSQLARILREQTLVDVDCWSEVPGSPLPPADIERQIRMRLEILSKELQ